MTVLAFLGFGIGEMLVISVGALLVFGGRLPEVMRNLGRAYAKFRHGMNEVAEPLRQEMRRIDVRTPPTSVPRRPPATPDEPPSRPEPAPYDAGPLPTDPADPEVPDDGRGQLPPTPWRDSGGGAADEPPPV